VPSMTGVDAVPSLELVEIEGDAVFLYAPYEEIADRPASERALDLALTMHQAFHARQQWMVARNMCSCEACKKVGTLRVKFVARSLCLFSLVVPPGSMTPVHDHPAWGLSGSTKAIRTRSSTSQAPAGSGVSAGARCGRAITTRCFLLATTCTAYAPPPRRPLFRSICLRTTLAACSATRSTSRPERRGRSDPAM
jgi:Protein of unknown function (DUF2652)